MPRPFDSFILLAEMRTGSNFLEENLNSIPGLKCWGEAFNPHFMGGAGRTDMAGLSLSERERDPLALLAAMRSQTEGLSGFRFFHDHDARVLDQCLPDPRCAKIVLTRNPLESFVSLQIARATNQWRLNDMKNARSAQITFDAEAFAQHVAELQAFQVRILRALHTSGQTAFYIAYEDIGDLDVLNGLAAWLGIDGQLERLTQKTKVQNPGELRQKVVNYDEMVAALGPLDPFNLSRTPNFEPRRGPAVPSFVTPPTAPVMFMPVPGGPTESVQTWLAGLEEGDLVAGRTQRELRKWKRQSTGHRSFTVLRHPVPRLHHAFCTHILMPGPACFAELRETLRSEYEVPIPAGAPGADYDAAAHRAAFLAFASFVKGNLGGQTSLRVDPAWASQSSVLQGMGQVVLPDLIIREEEAAERLSDLAAALGLTAPAYRAEAATQPIALSDIYDADVEAAVKAAYQRDYMMFGWAPWSATA